MGEQEQGRISSRPGGIRIKMKMPVLVGFLVAVLMASLVWSRPAPGQAAGPEIEIHHYLLQLDQQGDLLVKEQLIFTQPLTAGGITLALPPGAASIQVTEGAPGDGVVMEAGNEIKFTKIDAQATRLGLSYSLPAQGALFTLDAQTRYPTGALFVIFPEDQLKATSPQLADGGSQDMGGIKYRMLAGENLKAGSGFTIRATAREQAAAGGISRQEAPPFHNPGHIRFWYQSPFRGINAHLFLVLVIVIPLAAIGYYLALRRKSATSARSAPATAGEEEVFQRLRAREKVLLAKLTDLEQQHRQGAIEAAAYAELKAAYKQKLVDVRLRLRNLTE